MLPFLEIAPSGRAIPVVASIPHSGTFVPEWLASKFEPEALEALWNSDWFLPELYDFLPRLGVWVLSGTHSRYVGDLNRSEAELFGDFWRAMVPERTATGRSVYRQRPSEAELVRARDEHHRPYHERLAVILGELLRYTCYHDCSRIDEPHRPIADPARIAAARLRLRGTFEHALERLSGGMLV